MAARFASSVTFSVSRTSSGLRGASYGAAIPVMFVIWPPAAALYRPFGSRFGSFERSLHVKLDKIAGFHVLAHPVTVGPIRGHERAEHDHAGVDEELGDLANAPNVLAAVLGREAEVAAQTVADVVAVQAVGRGAAQVERALEAASERALGRAREPGEPQRYARWPRCISRSARSTRPVCQKTLGDLRAGSDGTRGPYTGNARSIITRRPPRSRRRQITAGRSPRDRAARPSCGASSVVAERVPPAALGDEVQMSCWVAASTESSAARPGW